MYIDPEVPAEVLKKANESHDKQQHLVCMWQRANYRGGFGYPPSPKKRMTPEQFARYKDGLSKIRAGSLP
jgi:hypothetical protein